MELDELKKSWNALDEQLKKEPIADEKQIAGMIAEYKANARSRRSSFLNSSLLNQTRFETTNSDIDFQLNSSYYIPV